MLQSLLWDDEVREADIPVLKTDVRVSAQELKMSTSLVDQLTTDFDPDKFSDEYQEQLRKLIAAKIETGDALDTAATFGEAEAGPPPGAEVIDLMEALRQSVERARASRTGSGSASSESSAGSGRQRASRGKAPARKAVSAKKAASAKKTTTAKSAAAKRAPGKKTAAKTGTRSGSKKSA
jgi:DNA end-binding protein Ku